MAGNRPRRSPAEQRRVERGPSGAADRELVAVFDEIQRVLDTPLIELVNTDEERAEAEELTRQATAAPAMARLREVVAFVGAGRRATQAGNLRAADAVELARRLGDHISDDVRSMADLPETAHAFRWAAAAEFLAWHGTRIVAGPRARELERDLASAWFMAAVTLLEHGVLDGFREGWRKSYVELLDAEVGGLLAAIAQAGGTAPLPLIDDGAWEAVASAYGYDLGDDAERRHVVHLVRVMVAQLADLGAVDVDHDQVALTGLGSTLAAVAVMASDDDLDDVDLIDTDAESLLLVCLEEDMEPAEARGHLLAWCQARPADEAADELGAAMLDDDDPDVWRLGLEALAMIDRRVARPVVQGLRSHPGLRPLATEWLRRHRPAPGRRGPG